MYNRTTDMAIETSFKFPFEKDTDTEVFIFGRTKADAGDPNEHTGVEGRTCHDWMGLRVKT